MAKHVFIFVPAFGNTVTTPTMLAIQNLTQTLAAKSIACGLSALSFPDIAELRSIATGIWYDTMPYSDHFLFIDADMAFQPDLVLDMLLFDEPLVGTIYPQRKMPLSWAGSGTGSTSTERRGSFMEVEGVGMGVTLIRRDVLRVMLEKMPELVDNRLELHPANSILQAAGAKRLIRSFEKMDIADRGIVSEDLSFCIRWRQCGGRVWASIGHPISHVGMYDYQGCYLNTVLQQQAQEEANRKALQDQLDLQTRMSASGHELPPFEVPLDIPHVTNQQLEAAE